MDRSQLLLQILDDLILLLVLDLDILQILLEVNKFFSQLPNHLVPVFYPHLQQLFLLLVLLGSPAQISDLLGLDLTLLPQILDCLVEFFDLFFHVSQNLGFYLFPGS